MAQQRIDTLKSLTGRGWRYKVPNGRWTCQQWATEEEAREAGRLAVLKRQNFEEAFVASLKSTDTDLLVDVAADIIGEDEDILEGHIARLEYGQYAYRCPVLDTLWFWARETGHLDSHIPSYNGGVCAYCKYLESLQARALGKASPWVN